MVRLLRTFTALALLWLDSNAFSQMTAPQTSNASYPYSASPRAAMAELQRIFRPDVGDRGQWLSQLSCAQIWSQTPPTALLSFLGQANPGLAEFYHQAWTPVFSLFSLRGSYLSGMHASSVPTSRSEDLTLSFEAHLNCINRGRTNHITMDYCNRIPRASLPTAALDPQGTAARALQSINRSSPMGIVEEANMRTTAERARLSSAQTCCSAFSNQSQRNRCLEYFNRWRISCTHPSPQTPGREANATAVTTHALTSFRNGNWLLWNTFNWRSHGLRFLDIWNTNIFLSASSGQREFLISEAYNTLVVSHESAHACHNAISLYLVSEGVQPSWTNAADWQDESMCAYMVADASEGDLFSSIDTLACSARVIRMRDERMYSSLYRAMHLSNAEIQCLTDLPILHPRERFPGYQCTANREHTVREETFADTFSLLNQLASTALTNAEKQNALSRLILSNVRDAEHPLGADVLSCLALNPNRRQQFNEIFGCRTESPTPTAGPAGTATGNAATAD